MPNNSLNSIIQKKTYSSQMDGIRVGQWLTFKPFTQEEILKIKEYKKEISFKDGTITSNREVDNSYRKTNVGWLYPTQENRWVYDKISNCIVSANNRLWKFDIFGINEAFQYAIYNQGHHYDWHLDTGVGDMTRKISASLQLSSPTDYNGGEMLIKSNREAIISPKELGTLIVFPSFLLHKVKPIISGQRESLVIWISGPPFR